MRTTTVLVAIVASLASGAPPRVEPAKSPFGTQDPGLDWINITVPGVGTMLAAVGRPTGPGPFATVVLLHGTHGFAREYARLAKEIAGGGLLAVAPCWFGGGAGAGAAFVTPIDCPQAPRLPARGSAEIRRILDALLEAVRGLPGVAPDRLALFGHSRGAGEALNYALQRNAIHALVLNSAGYPDELDNRVADLHSPLLILHGTADGASDTSGGGSMTDAARARRFEAALRKAGKPVEAHYYERGQHNSLFSEPAQHDDEVRRIVAFLQRRLHD